MEPTITSIINIIGQLNAYNKRLRAINPAFTFSSQLLFLFAMASRKSRKVQVTLTH